MASNVVVMHNNRRYVVKTTPSMLCREILAQACEKIGFRNIENYGLKNGKNTVDLALPVRLANLAAGAKLDIYKINAAEASKPITLALQCSDPPIRLTGTFPPTATLTEVLLHFEQESNGKLVIFGRRGEEAVLSVLGREFGITEGSGGGSTTLAGMGVGGNVLVRLGFRKVGTSTSTGSATVSAETSSVLSSGAASQTPVTPISQSSPPASVTPSQVVSPPPPTSSHTAPSLSPLPSDVPSTASRSTSEPSSLIPTPPSPEAIPSPPPPPPPEVFGPSNRNRIVYTAASASTPTAARLDLDDSVYNMTTEQAKTYQAYLSANAKSQSDRVLMTREMREAAEREKATKRAFNHGDVRIRFPDGTQIQGSFGAVETVGDIYAFVRDQLSSPDVPFQLHLLPRGELNDMEPTIREAGFAARTLLMLSWNRGGQTSTLKGDVLKDAVDIEGVAKELLKEESRTSKGKEKGNADTSSSKKLPKWLGKLTKK